MLPAGWRPPLPPPLAPNGQPLGSFGDRLLAFLIDALIMFAIALVWTVPIMIWWMSTVFNAMSLNVHRLQEDPNARPDFMFSFADFWLPYLVFIVTSIGLGLLLTYVYLVEYQLRRGQTIGKRAMKLRVVPVDPAAALTRSHLVKRWLVERVATSFVPLLGWVDGLWQLWDKPFQQCLHDKAAQTVVVKVG